MSSPVVIAKVARVEWELPRLSQETLIYQILGDTGLAPRFLGHVHEHGRVIGFILEKLEGREANIKDLSSCQSALQRLHDIGILHGDANRYNFIIQGDKARLIDFRKANYLMMLLHLCKLRWIVYVINWWRIQDAVQGSLGEISLAEKSELNSDGFQDHAN